jgi:hypothetical protein
MTNHTDEQWEAIASAWRKAANQNESDRLNAPEFVRWLKSEGYIKDYVCVPDRDLPGASGKFEGGVAFYRQSTWAAAEEGDPHSVWTLVHEGCHGICKHQGVRYRAHELQRRVLSASSDEEEFEANRLTACILAPFAKADFKPGMLADEVAARFGLSRESGKLRLQEFERLYRRQRGMARPLPPGIIDFLAEQERKGFRVTSLTEKHRRFLPAAPPSYEGDPCPSCGAFALVRAGVARKCDECGARLGED